MAGRAVVIGAGITGVLTANELARAGFRVVVAEAAHVGAGSSSRTAAGIRQQFSTVETVQGMRYAVRRYRELERELGEPVIVQNGYLFLYDDPERWRGAVDRVAVQRAAGLTEVEVLPAGELVTRFPWVDPQAVVGGTFCPTDGFLHPAVIYQEGARRARERGVTVLQGAQVTGGRTEGGRLVAVETTKGTLEADVFLDCTNAWTPRLAHALGAEPLPVAATRRYLWFVARSASMDRDTFARMPMVVTPSGVYCRPENADTLLMGWVRDIPPEPDFTYEGQDRIDPGFSHNSGIDAAPFEAWAHVAEVIPAVGGFDGVTATTSGFYAVTPDHNPFLGYDPRLPNLVRLVGFSGHGAMFGPFTAAVGRALVEAGRDLDRVTLDGEDIALAAFHIGRRFDVHETMVI